MMEQMTEMAVELMQGQSNVIVTLHTVSVHVIIVWTDLSTAQRLRAPIRRVCGPGMWMISHKYAVKEGDSFGLWTVEFERLKEARPGEVTLKTDDMSAKEMSDWLMERVRLISSFSESPVIEEKQREKMKKEADILWLISKKIDAAEEMAKLFGTRIALNLEAVDALTRYEQVGERVSYEPREPEDGKAEYDDWPDEGDQ